MEYTNVQVCFRWIAADFGFFQCQLVSCEPIMLVFHVWCLVGCILFTFEQTQMWNSGSVTLNWGNIQLWRDLTTFNLSFFPISLPASFSTPQKLWVQNYVFHLKLFWNWKIKETKPVKILHYVMHVFFFKIGHTLTKIWQNIDFIVHFFSSNVCPWVFLQRTHVDVQCLASFPLPCSILKGPTDFASWNPSDLSQIYSKCVTNLFHVCHTFLQIVGMCFFFRSCFQAFAVHPDSSDDIIWWYI